MDLNHIPVLLDECISHLDIKPDGVYADYTLGRGGHSHQIALRLTTGRLFCFDRDGDAIAAATERFAHLGDRVTLIRSDFRQAAERLRQHGVAQLDGILMDLGLSSPQIDDVSRGFSYSTGIDATIDMRMDLSAPLDAKTVVNEYPRERLRTIISEYGEERFAGRIADSIVASRPIETAQQLVEAIKKPLHAKALYGDSHPAMRTFQAIRIEVNDELGALRQALDDAAPLLKSGGRLCCISFHSLEDRMVKEHINAKINGCTCPSDFPRCVCGFKPEYRKVTKKPIVPSSVELQNNPRAHSAKLRVAEKL